MSQVSKYMMSLILDKKFRPVAVLLKVDNKGYSTTFETPFPLLIGLRSTRVDPRISVSVILRPYLLRWHMLTYGNKYAIRYYFLNSHEQGEVIYATKRLTSFSVAEVDQLAAFSGI